LVAVEPQVVRVLQEFQETIQFLIQLVLKVLVNLQPQEAVEVVEPLVQVVVLEIQVAQVVEQQELLQLLEQEMLDVTLPLKEMLEELLPQLMKVREVVVILQ
jgi:hypothetical protein